MPSSLAPITSPWLWKMALFGASLAALAVGALAYLVEDSSSLLLVRLIKVLMTPIVTVGGGFMAAQLRHRVSQK